MSSFAPSLTTSTNRTGFRQVPRTSRKRKDRDTPEASPRPPLPKSTKLEKKSDKPQKPSNNMVLAGCLAHEFLTRGTLLGQRMDIVGHTTAPVAGKQQTPAAENAELAPRKKMMAYADVSCLLMSESGAHIPGVVNPTQLAGWINMKR